MDADPDLVHNARRIRTLAQKVAVAYIVSARAEGRSDEAWNAVAQDWKQHGLPIDDAVDAYFRASSPELPGIQAKRADEEARHNIGQLRAALQKRPEALHAELAKVITGDPLGESSRARRQLVVGTSALVLLLLLAPGSGIEPDIAGTKVPLGELFLGVAATVVFYFLASFVMWAEADFRRVLPLRRDLRAAKAEIDAGFLQMRLSEMALADDTRSMSAEWRDASTRVVKDAFDRSNFGVMRLVDSFGLPVVLAGAALIAVAVRAVIGFPEPPAKPEARFEEFCHAVCDDE